MDGYGKEASLPRFQREHLGWYFVYQGQVFTCKDASLSIFKAFLQPYIDEYLRFQPVGWAEKRRKEFRASRRELITLLAEPEWDVLGRWFMLYLLHELELFPIPLYPSYVLAQRSRQQVAA